MDEYRREQYDRLNIRNRRIVDRIMEHLSNEQRLSELQARSSSRLIDRYDRIIDLMIADIRENCRKENREKYVNDEEVYMAYETRAMVNEKEEEE